MLNTNEAIIKMIYRIKVSEDGSDFMNYLRELIKQNYEGFKRSSSEMNDIHKGKALALDDLLNMFETAEQQLNKQQPPHQDWGT